MTEVFDGLEPFVAIADAGSFAGAARRLGVTTSAVSKALARLESDVGVRLVDRTPRSVALTADGEQFLAQCRGAVEAVRNARAKLAVGRNAAVGTLRVALPPLLGPRIVAALPALFAAHPLLAVEIATRPTADVSLQLGTVGAASWIARTLSPTHWLTAASPASLARTGPIASPAALAAHACLRWLRPDASPVPWTFAAHRWLPPSGAFASERLDDIVAAAIAGVGIIHAPDVFLGDALRAGTLVPVLPDRAPGPPLVALLAPGRQRLPRARAFVDFARGIVRELATRVSE